MSESPLTIRPINTGYIPTVPLQYWFHFSAAPYLKGISNEKTPLPDFAFLIEGGDQLVLVDTGMSWTERANEYHHPGSWQDEGNDIISQLAKLGYSPDDIDVVILTHLHWDHSYHIGEFKNARIIIHQREWDFANDPIPLYYKSYEAPELGLVAQFKGIEPELIDGDIEVVPGIRVFETFGHSPGHISVEVDCADGESYIMAGDSMFSLLNLNEIPELHYDIIPPGRFYNIVECWKSVELQKKMARTPQNLLLAHDETLPARVEKTPIIGLKD